MISNNVHDVVVVVVIVIYKLEFEVKNLEVHKLRTYYNKANSIVYLGTF